MKSFLFPLLLCCTVLFAQDQAPTGGRPTGGRTETATRGVVRYKGLERALVEAGQQKNQQTINRLVADDFEVRSAERNEPIPREIWEQNWTSANVTWFQIRDMAVHEFGDVAVVSFLLDRHGDAGGNALPATLFIVDVWRQAEGKLAVRYVSMPSKPAGAQLRPTGKE